MDKKKFLSLLALGSILILLYTCLANVDSLLSNVAGFLASTFSTIFIGAILAFVLDIPVSFFEHRFERTGVKVLARYARALSILVSLVIFFIAIAVVLGFIIPSTIDAISMISQAIVLLSDRLQGNFTNEEPGFDAALHSLLNWLDMSLDELGSRLRDFARDNSPRFITSTFNTILGTISSFVTFFIALVFAIYFVSAKDMICTHVVNLLDLVDRPRLSSYLRHLAAISYQAFRHFVVAQALEALIIGALCTAGMLVLRLPNAAMIGVLTGVTALIPVYGAFVGAIFGAIVIAVTSPIQALAFAVFIIILQQLEGNLIYPRVVGGSLGLPSVYTFTLVTVCGAAFGLVGMLFAVPVGSICYTLLKEKRRSKADERTRAWNGCTE